MASAETNDSSIFEVPWDLLDACNGFSFDMGGSVMKLVYIAKNEWKDHSQRDKDSKGILHIKSFSHDDFKQGTIGTFVKENVFINRNRSDKPDVFSTGFWVNLNGAAINEQLGVNLKCLMESDCFVKALIYMIKNTPRRKLILEPPSEEIEACRKQNEINLKMLDGIDFDALANKPNRNLKDYDAWFCMDDLKHGDELITKNSKIFPCVFAMCGSGWANMCVSEDGVYTSVNASYRSGKMWLGLGSVLAGGCNYKELMALAEKGNLSKVDMVLSDFTNQSKDQLDDGNTYKQIMDNVTVSEERPPRVVFSFGKAEEKTINDFNKEDLVASLLNIMVSDLTQTVIDAARISNAQHVFFCGGFTAHPLVRSMIYREWKQVDCGYALMNEVQGPIHCHFVKDGQHYGALGALIHHKTD